LFLLSDCVYVRPIKLARGGPIRVTDFTDCVYDKNSLKNGW